MAGLLEGDMKEFRATAKREDDDWKEWMKDRKFGRCKCGTMYSYGYESNYRDPGNCPECGNRLGEIK